jgi:DNA-binding NarL/FixJ family response regulator
MGQAECKAAVEATWCGEGRNDAATIAQTTTDRPEVTRQQFAPGQPQQVLARVACVDSNTVIREGLPNLLSRVQVTAAYDSVEALLTDRPDVDVVLLDLVLRHSDNQALHQGAAAVRTAVQAGYRVIIHTDERRREVLAGCLALGARGIVHKSESLAVLEQAVLDVIEGAVVTTNALVGLAEVVERHGELPSLSARQRQILSARARGESFRSIAERLFISRKTAEGHMELIVAKFAEYLREHSPADLERLLGLGPGDVFDWSQDDLRR